jgi:hypothetical protein
MQIINILDEAAPCKICGSDLTVLGKFIYLGVASNTANQKDERCKCTTCQTEFITHYDFFDAEGHINSFIFSGDVNDPTYNWQDKLTPEQKEEIGKHLFTCKICSGRMDEEVTSDAWLASLLHNYKKS